MKKIKTEQNKKYKVSYEHILMEIMSALSESQQNMKKALLEEAIIKSLPKFE